MVAQRVETAIKQILSAAASGHFGFDAPLPREADLAKWLDVARPTMREAVRILAERGVLEVRHGNGTYLRPPSHWTHVPSVVWWLSQENSPQETGAQLVELREMIEVGAARLAAERRSEKLLAQMGRTLDDFDKSHGQEQIEQAVAADIKFHNLIFQAANNPFLSVLFAPLSEALRESRRLTTEVAEVRGRAAGFHRQIFAAIQAGDAEGAGNAMMGHMRQTRDDIAKFLPEG